LPSRPSAEERARIGKLVAGGSRATLPEDPAAVIASNEAGAATLHCADRGAGADEATGVGWGSSVRGSGDDSDEREKRDEERMHCDFETLGVDLMSEV
jgi:hypothetical protein